MGWVQNIRFASRCMLATENWKTASGGYPMWRRDSLNAADSAGETAMMGFQETPAQLF
jgi:hypothetical protein